MKFVFFTFLFFVVGCTSSIPENVLPPAKMKAVLWDVMQADELADYNAAKDSSFNNLPKHVKYYQAVLSAHKISKQEFVRSFNYYQNHPELLKAVLDSIRSYGERLQHTEKINNLPRPDAKD